MKLSYFLLLLLILLPIAYMSAQDVERSDGQIFLNKPAWQDKEKEKESAIDDYIGLYQKFISGNRGSNCAMYPSCSNFGLKTFRETNFANAMALTSERLLRCGHEHQYYDLTYRGEEFRLLDFPAYTTNPDSLKYAPSKKLFAYSDSKNLEDSALLFVKYLINNEFYSEALLEINRLQFLDKRNESELYVNKIISLRALDEGEKAVFEYETKMPQSSRKNAALVLQAALAYYDLTNYTGVCNTLVAIDSASASDDVLSKKYRLQGLANAHLSRWADARTNFAEANAVQENEVLYAKNKALVENALTFKPKSSATASFLSVIPGLGYLYTGHKQTALTAFLINGVLAYATYTSIKNENYGVGALTGVFGLSFYVGNILGSGRSADRYNNSKRKQILNSLENNNIFFY